MSFIPLPIVDDADVQRFVDALLKDKDFAQAPSAEAAHKFALDSSKSLNRHGAMPKRSPVGCASAFNG